MANKKKPGSRGMVVRVKTARDRSNASTRWLQRQLNDPYVVRAKKEGWRSRAAFKLIELDEKYKLLKPGQQIIDLGAAPGGWVQVAAKKIGEKGRIVAIDLLEFEPIPGADILQLDFMADDAPQQITSLLGTRADIVLSDMSPNTSGDPSLDHMRIMMLCEAAFDFALEVLKPGGSFIAKVFQGGTEKELLARMRSNFTTVKHAKPKASRPESPENYVIALGFKGQIS